MLASLAKVPSVVWSYVDSDDGETRRKQTMIALLGVAVSYLFISSRLEQRRIKRRQLELRERARRKREWRDRKLEDSLKGLETFLTPEGINSFFSLSKVYRS